MAFFLFLDSFTATEALLDRHLEDILKYNRQAVIPALQAEIKKIINLQNHRKKVRRFEQFYLGCKWNQ